jgi:hypothetical protein
MGSRAADDQNRIAGTYLPGECGIHLVGVEFKVFLRRPYRFVRRKANLSLFEGAGSCGATLRSVSPRRALVIGIRRGSLSNPFESSIATRS